MNPLKKGSPPFPNLGQIRISRIFDTALNYIVNILILYIIIILAVSLGKTLFTVKLLFNGDPIGHNLSRVIADILSFLVMIELFRSFVEYFKAKRIRLHTMIDPAIIFIVRELILQLYAHEKMLNSNLTGFAVLLFCLGLIRTMALVFSPEGWRPKADGTARWQKPAPPS